MKEGVSLTTVAKFPTCLLLLKIKGSQKTYLLMVTHKLPEEFK